MSKALAEVNNSIKASNAVFANGSLSEIARLRWQNWIGMVLYLVPLQAPGALGFFFIGLASVRSGVLADPKAPLWARSRRVYLPAGVLVSILGSTILFNSPNPNSSGALVGMALLLLAAPFSSLGYIGLIAKWAEGPVTKLTVFIARGGTASLTAYLLQSLVLSLVFCGYGLGLYREISAFNCIALALCTGLFSIAIVSIWRMKFRHGPFEVLLRKWTYQV